VDPIRSGGVRTVLWTLHHDFPFTRQTTNAAGRRSTAICYDTPRTNCIFGIVRLANVYQGTCSACGYTSPPVTAGGLHLLTIVGDEDERRQAGEPIPVELQPLNAAVLDQYGLSFPTAAWGGRLVEVQRVVCQGCGRAYERRWLTSGRVPVSCSGCLAVIAAAAAVATTAAAVAGNVFVGLVAGGFLGAILLATVELGSSRIIRNRYPHRVAAVDTPSTCPDCGAAAALPPDRLRGPVPCPRCGATALDYLPTESGGTAAGPIPEIK
jgi:hypothetical protein